MNIHTNLPTYVHVAAWIFTTTVVPASVYVIRRDIGSRA